jgi:hypothetical protein
VCIAIKAGLSTMTLGIGRRCGEVKILIRVFFILLLRLLLLLIVMMLPLLLYFALAATVTLAISRRCGQNQSFCVFIHISF